MGGGVDTHAHVSERHDDDVRLSPAAHRHRPPTRATSSLRALSLPPRSRATSPIRDQPHKKQTMVELCLDRNVLAASPFVRLLDKEPSTLWSNSEVYLQQIEDGMVPH